MARIGAWSPIICGIPPPAKPAKPVRSVEGALGNPESPIRGWAAITGLPPMLSWYRSSSAGVAGCGAGGAEPRCRLRSRGAQAEVPAVDPTRAGCDASGWLGVWPARSLDQSLVGFLFAAPVPSNWLGPNKGPETTIKTRAILLVSRHTPIVSDFVRPETCFSAQSDGTQEDSRHHPRPPIDSKKVI